MKKGDKFIVLPQDFTKETRLHGFTPGETITLNKVLYDDNLCSMTNEQGLEQLIFIHEVTPKLD